jgi:hypothetical protein
MMQASLEMGTTKFSSDRMVREYFEVMYADAPEPIVPAGKPGAAQAAKS